MQEVTKWIVHNLDAKYENEDLQSVVSTNCTYLSLQDPNKLLELLTEFKEIFDGTLGNWNTKPVSFELKEGTKPYQQVVPNTKVMQRNNYHRIE